MTTPNLPTWLFVAEVAAHLRVSKMTVHREILRGNLPAIRVGRSVRIHRQDFTDYLHAANVLEDTA